eukprot:5852891-Prymnesium_polylepis.1
MYPCASHRVPDRSGAPRTTLTERAAPTARRQTARASPRSRARHATARATPARAAPMRGTPFCPWHF